MEVWGLQPLHQHPESPLPVGEQGTADVTITRWRGSRGRSLPENPFLPPLSRQKTCRGSLARQPFPTEGDRGRNGLLLQPPVEQKGDTL